MSLPAPVIGIPSDHDTDRMFVRNRYIESVLAAGGHPVILPPVTRTIPRVLEECDGFILPGGDDPDMTQWGIPLHPSARPMDARRQEFEWALLEAMLAIPETPVLGICLGMQMMTLHAGGILEQHLPDVLPTAGIHWGQDTHPVTGSLGPGDVHSHHRQAMVDPGTLDVVSRAPDGVIEAVRDPSRPFYLGVQWHPEKTGTLLLGADLFSALVEHARGARLLRPVN